MSEFATARVNMVEGQLRPNKVSDPKVVSAFLEIPREAFMPKAGRAKAYVDEDIPIGNGRYLSEPMILARLVQEAAIRPTDVVLDVGCGRGYSSAILSRLADTVVAIDDDPEFVEAATATLAGIGIDNVIVLERPMPQGYPEQAPYDVILINGAVAEVPEGLFDQLAEGGRLVTVVAALGNHLGQGRLYQKLDSHVSSRWLFDGSTPILPGFEPAPRFEF